MKKVLIIGGAGYIGGYTTDYLMAKGYEVCVYDNLTYETRYLKKVKFVFGDIRDTELVYKTAKGYDVILLMAALVGDPACAVDNNLTDSINRQPIKDICERLNGKHIIFMSTCSVYGNQNNLLNEDSTVSPLSAYATTKLAAEKYVQEKNGTIFRLGTVYGIGDTYSRIRLDLVVNALTMKALYDKKITIFGGNQWRPLISVKDIAGYIEESIRMDIRGLYILSSYNMKMSELATKLSLLIPVEINYTDILFEDARNYRVDNSLSMETFKYRPLHHLKEEILEMIEIFRQQRIRDVSDIAYHNGNFIKQLYNGKM